MTSYTKAPEVEAIAKALISEHHEHLQSATLEYAFVKPTPKKGGEDVWGKAIKKGPLDVFLRDEDADEDAFFAIEIASDVWKHLTAEQKRALVDHELSHCWWEEGKYTVLPHDLEEFSAIYARHGAWRESIQQFLDAGAQPALDLEGHTAERMRHVEAAA
jgi:hypothetical protein